MYALDNCFTSLSISDINSLSYFVCFVSSVDVWGRDERRKEPGDRSFLYKLEDRQVPYDLLPQFERLGVGER